MRSPKEYLHRILGLLYVPQCVSCGERLPYDEPDAVLCPVCRASYEDAKTHTCPVCGARLGECLCAPPTVRKNGVSRLVKLFRYRSGETDLPENKLIYRLKHENIGPLQSFCAAELGIALSGRMDKEPDAWCVTYPPRSRASCRRYGFDHAARVAKEIAGREGIPCVRTLVRLKDGQQKKLNREERRSNATSAFAPVRGLDLSGRRVLLVDDIATTGATLAAAARILRRAGAKEVLCAVLAVTL